MGAAGWALDRAASVLTEGAREQRSPESASRAISAMYDESAPVSAADVLGAAVADPRVLQANSISNAAKGGRCGS